jgi:hypothetical protein
MRPPIAPATPAPTNPARAEFPVNILSTTIAIAMNMAIATANPSLCSRAMVTSRFVSAAGSREPNVTVVYAANGNIGTEQLAGRLRADRCHEPSIPAPRESTMNNSAPRA